MMVEESSTFFSFLNLGICLHEKDRVSLSPSSSLLRTLCRDNRRVNTLSFATVCGDWSCLQKERRMKSLLNVFKVLFNGKNIITQTHDHGKDKSIFKSVMRSLNTTFNVGSIYQYLSFSKLTIGSWVRVVNNYTYKHWVLRQLTDFWACSRRLKSCVICRAETTAVSARQMTQLRLKGRAIV